MTVLTTARDRLQRLVEVMPVAWRQDRIFRIATLGAGLTGALLLLRVIGPQDPAPLPATADPGATGVPTLAGPGLTPLPALTPATVPKIAPGHALDDVTIAPAPDGDRFGVAPPAARK